MTTFVCSTLAVQDKLMAIVYHFFFTYGYAMAMRFRTRITSSKKKRERTTCCTQCLKASNSLRHRSLCTSWYRDAIHWPYAVAWVEQDAMPRAKSATPLACPLFIWQLSEELLQFPEFPWSFRFFRKNDWKLCVLRGATGPFHFPLHMCPRQQYAPSWNIRVAG